MSLSNAQGQRLAQLVRSWLSNSGQGDPSGELASFVDDLENAQNVGVWAGVNFERILPFRAPESERLRRISIIRNAGIFLPIGVTWFALEHAARSWSRSQSGNFLQHWQSMDGIFTLRNVAWFDAGLILVLILMTLWLGFNEDGGQSRRDLENQHLDLMVALERDLSGYRYLSLQDINNAAGDTLQALQESTKLVEISVDKLADASEKAQELITATNETVKTTYEPAIQRLDSTLTGLTAAVGAHQGMAQLVRKIQDDMSVQTVNLGQSVMDAASTIDSKVSALIDSLDRKLTDLARVIESQLQASSVSVQSTSKAAIADVSSAAATVATSLTNQTNQVLQGVAASLSQVAGSLETIARDLEGTNNKVMANTRTLNDDLAALHDQLTEIIKMRRA